MKVTPIVTPVKAIPNSTGGSLPGPKTLRLKSLTDSAATNNLTIDIIDKRILRVEGPEEKKASLIKAPAVNYVAQELKMVNSWGNRLEPVFPPSPRLALLLIEKFNCNPTPRCQAWLDEMRFVQEEARNCATYIESPDDPYAFQNAGINFMKTRRRVLCGDTVGLGKTREALEASAPLLAAGKTVLVLTIKTLATQWREEVRKWLPSTKILLLHTPVVGKERKIRREKVFESLPSYTPGGLVVIANWDALLGIEHLIGGKLPLAAIVGDEAHLVANRKAQRSILMARLCRRVPFVFLLTGTPVERGPADMWHLLHILDPEVFSSYWAFYNVFTDFVVEWNGSTTIEGAKNVEVLKDLLRPYYIRRTRQQVLKQVKDPITVPHVVTLSAKHRELYDQVEKEVYLELNSVDSTGGQISVPLDIPNAVTRLIRLRQCALNGNLLLFKTDEPEPNFKWNAQLAAKMDAAYEVLATSFENTKVVIFVTFRAAAFRFHRMLQKALGPDTSALYLSGMSTTIHTDFAKGVGPNWLISTPDSLGLGANLQIASDMFFLDLPWSNRKYLQAVGRLVRLGQEAQTGIHYFYAEDTVDAYIHDLLQRKNQTFDEVVVTRAVIDGLAEKYK